MDEELWNYIRRAAEKSGKRFFRHLGTIYEVELLHFGTGPCWRIEEVLAEDLPALRPNHRTGYVHKIGIKS